MSQSNSPTVSDLTEKTLTRVRGTSFESQRDGTKIVDDDVKT